MTSSSTPLVALQQMQVHLRNGRGVVTQQHIVVHKLSAVIFNVEEKPSAL